jgi:hypothetical protein
VDLLEELLRHMSVYRPTIGLTHQCLDSHHLNLLLSDEYPHLRTFRNLDPTMGKLLLDSSSLRTDMIGDIRRRQSTDPSRDTSSRDKVSMGNNKVDRGMEYPRELDVECRLATPVQSGKKLIIRYGVAPCPSDPLALTNRLVVHPADFPPEVEFVIIRNHFVLSVM